MSTATIIIVVLLILLVFAYPGWGHSRSWGSTPFGIIVAVLVVLLILMAFGVVSL